MLKDLDIKPVLTIIKNPQSNAPVEQVHQVILNMIFTNDIYNKTDYIYPWNETLAYIAWAIRSSYHRSIQYIPGQAVFGRYIIVNVVSVVHWRVINSGK